MKLWIWILIIVAIATIAFFVGRNVGKKIPYIAPEDAKKDLVKAPAKTGIDQKESAKG